MNASVRLRLLGAFALATGLWSAWVVYQPGDVVGPEANRRARAPQRVAAAAVPARNLAAQAAAPAPVSALALRGTVTVAALRNPFEAVPWVTPREAPPSAAPVGPIAAPAIVEPPTAAAAPSPEPPLQLPYKYMGMHTEQNASPSVFLVLGERLIVARSGDTVEGGFRLDAVSAAELTFVHVERNVTLRLSVAKGSL